MGYYSDAALCLRESDFRGILTEAKKIGGYAYKFFDDADITVFHDDTGEKILCVMWSDVKWYRDFPEIAMLETWMDEGNGYHPYNFVRIGEDYADVECRQSSNYEFDEYISPERYISVIGGSIRCRYSLEDAEDGRQDEICPVSESDRDSIFEMLT